jgi:hypothetical protein
MKNPIICLLAIFLISSCKTKETAVLSQIASRHGEEFEAKAVKTYDQLLTDLSKKGSLEDVVVQGTVTGVCQAKGCWMTLVSTKNSNTPEMFVKFKDYAFFMPKDLAGGKVIMKGKAYKEITSVADLKHYAEDEGKSAEEIAKITKPKEEFKFLASGVQILK